MSFQVLFPEELPELRPMKNLPRASKEPLNQEIKRKLTHASSSACKAVELPKIDQCAGSQVNTDIPEPKTPMLNIIPDNEFLDMKELFESPERTAGGTPMRRHERTGPLGEKTGVCRQWMRSEEKQYRLRSPPPIILENPLINRSNRFLKICRSKAFSLRHNSSRDPCEMTFYPPKYGSRPCF